ncbi:MAG: hypothetical protein QOK31_464 [Solirubrobacteraceae bacterium]|jgi:hypothetical protein|nr:hypothetical protein [Solirubrobacteraceae bacterium]
MKADERHSETRRRRIRGLVLAPLLGLALLVGSSPAGAAAPNRVGAAASQGQATAIIPAAALDAPQIGRPAGTVTGRRTH